MLQLCIIPLHHLKYKIFSHAAVSLESVKGLWLDSLNLQEFLTSFARFQVYDRVFQDIIILLLF